MKVLIWIGCFFVNGMVTAVLEENGVTLGAIPTVILCGATIWLARTLCQKWDEYKANKSVEGNIAVQELGLVVETNSDKVCFCRKCGEKLIDNSQFCRKCGTKIDKEI